MRVAVAKLLIFTQYSTSQSMWDAVSKFSSWSRMTTAVFSQRQAETISSHPFIYPPYKYAKSAVCLFNRAMELPSPERQPHHFGKAFSLFGRPSVSLGVLVSLPLSRDAVVISTYHLNAVNSSSVPVTTAIPRIVIEPVKITNDP